MTEPDAHARKHGDSLHPGLTEKYAGTAREQRGRRLTCVYVCQNAYNTVVYHDSGTGTDGNRMFFDHWKSLKELDNG